MEGAVASSAGRERPIGFIGLMRNRNYALLWWGQLVSEVGNRFHWVAVSLWVYSATGSAGSVSLAVASMFVGSLLVGLWAGVLVDRWDRRKILVVSDLVRGALVALIPSLMGISVWLVYADLVLISIATAFFRPAIFAVIPSIVGQRHLLPANSFFTAMDTGTEIFGPALAGLLALRGGYAPLLYIDAVTYVVSGICMTLLSGREVSWASGHRLPREDNAIGTRSLIGGVLEGFRYIRTDRLQWQLFLLLFPAFLVGSGLNSLQTPLAKGAVGISDAEFGTFQSVWGLGFLAGSLLLGWFGIGIRKPFLLVAGFLLQAASTAGMSLSRSFATLTLSAFGVGLGNTIAFISLATIVMEVTPREIIGRVVSVRQVGLAIVRIITPIVFGAGADLLGVREAIIVLVAVGVLGTLTVSFVSDALWSVDRVVQGARPWGEREVWRRFIGGYSPEFSSHQQIELNVGTMFLSLLGLAALLVGSAATATVFVISTFLVTCLGFLSKATHAYLRRWRLVRGEHMFAKTGRFQPRKEGVQASR